MKYVQLVIAILIVVPVLILSMFVAILPAAIMRLFKADKAANKWMRIHGTLVSKTIVWSFNTKLIVEGLEKIPPEGTPICFVANHQSMIDIPAVVAGLHIWAGFIAKAELKKVPLLSSWIKSINCVYIDRKSPRSSVQAILKGVENIGNGIPMFVFPEGTRSKTGDLGEFKNGSLKLATRAKAVIVPITIDGTRKAIEQKSGARRVIAHISVSDPIPTASLDEEQLKELPNKVYGAIERQFKSFMAKT